MIYLDLKKNDFKSNSKWPLLYTIAEIYLTTDISVTDTQVSELLKTKYNLIADRRTIGQYRQILSEYFEYKFKKEGYGNRVVGERQIELEKAEKQHDNIEYFDKVVYIEVEKNVKKIQKAIKNDYCLTINIKRYVTRQLNEINKVYTLVPLQIFYFRNRYFLFSYCPTINNHFIVDLKNHALRIKQRPGRFFLRNVKKVNLKDYISKKSEYIYTGHLNWDHDIEYDRDFDQVYCFTHEITDIMVSIDEKYDRSIDFEPRKIEKIDRNDHPYSVRVALVNL